MESTYSRHAEICARFYAASLDARAVAQFVWERAAAAVGERALFVGGMFEVARCLALKGLQLTVVDYSEEMVALGRQCLPEARVLQADLAALTFRKEFDIVLVMGRVFTHLISESALMAGISGCAAALCSGGRLLADNYEDNKIQRTSYFNGVIECREADFLVRRESRTALQSAKPCVVRWDARYSGQIGEKGFDFCDSMEHRAFSRQEFATYLERGRFVVNEQGDNFDETSFFTYAKLPRL